MSEKHLQRYADEFAGRRNARHHNALDQIRGVAEGMEGKRLTYKELTHGKH